MAGKVIITAALTGGIHDKSAHPKLPEQPGEIIGAALDCYNAGAAIVHLHARDMEGRPTSDMEVYKEIHAGIRSACPVIIQDTTGGGANLTVEQRIKVVEAKPEMASLNMGTMVRTTGGNKGTVFLNTREDIEFYITEMNRHGVKPEMEVYNQTMMEEVDRIIQKGLLTPPYVVNMVLNMPYQGALRGSARNLVSLVDGYLPKNTLFTVTAIGQTQLPLTTMSMLLGGNVRVGLEDNIYYRKGELARDNAQLVERAVRIARELEIEIAGPDEAREILGLKKNV